MDNSTIVRAATTVGIISTTTFWSMNFTINYLAFPCLLLGGVPKSSVPANKLSSRFIVPSTDETQVSDALLNRQWQEMYWRGHRWGPASAVLSGIAFLNAAYFSTPESIPRYCYAAAAAAAVSVVPWTIAIMVPMNDELHRRGDAQRLAEDKSETNEIKGDGRDLMTLIRTWLFYNKIRASLALVGTVAGIAGTFQ
ncbi:hypothetical protein LIA77_00513 [Sarocladium implicatum]|nr:hypothetical protein LIA77_00513 [Sarocladium implicatum]